MSRTTRERGNSGSSLFPLLAAALAIMLTFLILFAYLSGEHLRKSEQQSLNQLRQLVEMAYNTIHPRLVDYHWLRLSKNETIQEIRKILRHMTFYEEEGWNYIFMSSYEGVFLVQTISPELEMTNQWDLQDSRGLYIIRELTATAKENNESGGFVTYYYPAPGQSEPQEKVSFVMGIPEIDCYIGTGRYMGRIREDQRQFTLRAALLGTGFTLLFAGLIVLAWRLLSRQNRALYKEVEERSRSEEAFRNKETQLRTVLDTMPEMVWVKDLHENYLACNKKFSQFLGSPEEEILRKGTSDFFPPTERERINSLDKKVYEIGGPLTYEEQLYIRSQDKTVDHETTKTPMHDQNGNLVGILGLSRDISERKDQQRELSRLRNFLTNIIDSMPSQLIGIDTDHRITQWNRAAQENHNLLAPEVLGQPLSKIIPWLGPQEHRLDKVLNPPGEAVSFTLSRREIRPEEHLSITVYPLAGKESPGAVIMIDDISDKIRLEEMMIQSEKMLSVGGLAAGMAHEINNPLAGMMQTAEVLARRLGDKTLKANIQAAAEAGLSLDALENYIQSRGIDVMTRDILESGGRAALIIKNMLSFARKSEAAKSTYSIPDLLDTILELARTDYDLGRQFDFKSIEIIKEYAPDLPLVPCDGSQIQQVIFNLLKNGAEATHHHYATERRMGRDPLPPRIILRAYSKKGSGKITIEVEDNGPGMEDGIRRRVFEPFFTTKPVGLGTGLGLSVSYFIITEAHGGTMDLITSPGKGARFIIQLPLQEGTVQ